MKRPSLIQLFGPVVLLAIAMAACAKVQLGETTKAPLWRRPGPAVTEPVERQRVPDDSFRAFLAEGESPWEGG